MLLNSRPHTGTLAESLFIPGPGLDTLPRATQLTQRVTTCVTPLFSYAEHVEQMTWLIKKSHRSSAPSNTQGRDGARPPHSSEAAGPNPGRAAGGPAADPPGPSGRLGAHEAPDPPGSRDPWDGPDPPVRSDVPGPRDGTRTPADSAPEYPTSSTPAPGPPDGDSGTGAPPPEPPGAAEGSAPPPEPPTGATASQHDSAGRSSAGQDSASHDSAGHDSANRAARLNAAFRSATRSVWPGTEDRQAEDRPGGTPPEPEPPDEPGLTSFGPLGAGALANRQIWEPRRLHQVPRRRRPAPKPAAGDRTQPPPQDARAPQDTPPPR